MPVYNGNGFLRLAIESILDQTYKPFELIIVDDASTDNSWQVISEYQKKHPTIIKAKHLTKNRNKGGEVAGNIAFSMANPQSMFIARMDADDIALPHRLATQVEYLQKNPDITAVGSIVRIIDDKNNKLGYKQAKASPEELREAFFEVSPMIHPTVMFRRSQLPSTSHLYLTDLDANNDYLTFALMAADGHQFANIQEPLLLYRIHDNNDSVGNLRRTYRNTRTARIRMVREYGYRPSLKSSVIFSIQFVTVPFIPEKLLQKMYLHSRGFLATQSTEKEITS